MTLKQQLADRVCPECGKTFTPQRKDKVYCSKRCVDRKVGREGARRRAITGRRCSIEGCTNACHARGWCVSHYSRWLKTGDVQATKAFREFTERGTALWWLTEAASIQTDGCLDWPFGRDGDGYGAVFFRGRQFKAHHVALMFVGREPPPPGLETRHLCGRPCCVNPQHLKVGTPSENQHDRVGHGTSWRGEAQPAHKLTREDVFAIRASSEPNSVLAERYGVDRSHIKGIKSGRKWGWL